VSDGPRILINRLDEWSEFQGCESHLKRALRLALGAGAPTSAEQARVVTEVSLTCLPDEEIRQMNREYLGRDALTDVLAFPLADEGGLVGDIYIAPGVVRDNAAEHGERPADELLRVAIHGALHVLGHDHPAGEGREQSDMFRLQEELLTRVTGG